MPHKVQIKGQLVADDDLRLDMGEITGAWWEVPLPPCPDCGGDLVWYEAGYVPGTRKCMGKPTGPGEKTYDQDGGCGSLFNVHTEGGHAILVRERFYT